MSTHGELPIGLQRSHAHDEQVVEVDDALALLVRLVARVELRHGLGPERRGAPDPGDFGGIGLRIEHPGLGPLDLGDDVERGHGIATRPQQRSDETDLRLGELGGPLIGVGPPLAELGVGNGVEGPGGDALTHAELAEAVGEFPSGLSREGQRQHA